MKSIKFHIGDKVTCIDSDLVGKVTSVERYVISIEDQDGFIRHFKPNELIVIQSSELQNHLEKNKENYSKDIVVEKSIKKTIKKSVEIDLHMHQITTVNRYMSNFEMLSKQVNVAKQALEKAIKEKRKKIIFIHGVGQGVLKKELYKLKEKYPIEMNDANYKEFGKGATEVRIFWTKEKNKQKHDILLFLEFSLIF